MLQVESEFRVMIRLSPLLFSRYPFSYSFSHNANSLRLETIYFLDKSMASLRAALGPQNLYKLFIEPRSVGDQARHREFIVNVLLAGLATITIIKILICIFTDYELGLDQEEKSLLINGVFLLLVSFIWRLNRRGRSRFTAYYLLGLLCLQTIRITLNWSFEMPIAELMYAVIIVTAGIILKARSALIVTGITSMLLLGISYAQITGYLRPNTRWVQQDFQMSDSFGYIAILCVIALVAWLSNREINNSLLRARASEAALAKERDNLEIQVIEKTHKLLETQLLRNTELERFAEFGRVSATLLHEVSNPLTAASINLGLFDGNESETITSARKNLQQLERYIEAARHQLKVQGKLENFSIRYEFRRLLLMMEPIATRNGIKIFFESKDNYRLFGDPVKFNQVLANLISNSVDAYQDVVINPAQKNIYVHVSATPKFLKLKVIDWGKGIEPEAIAWLFKPFYSTKSNTERSMGIGLNMVKRVVEEDFHGNVNVVSSPRLGTSFIINLKR